MGISMIGIDYNRASVDIRAGFSFTKKNAAAAMERLKREQGVLGCIILSTCNRMEIWASAQEEWQGSLYEFLCREKEKVPGEFREYFVQRTGKYFGYPSGAGLSGKPGFFSAGKDLYGNRERGNGKTGGACT